MKKEWHAPSIETLDVRMTESGNYYTPEEDVIFAPSNYPGVIPDLEIPVGPLPPS